MSGTIARVDAMVRVVRAAQALRHARRREGMPETTLRAFERALDEAVDAYEVVR